MPLPATIDPSENKGFHPILERDHPYIWIDACIQVWPDADLPNAHRHGATAYAVTCWRPLADVGEALEGLMSYYALARQHPNLTVVERAEDIRRAKREGRAGLILATQDGAFIDTKLHRVEAFARLGLRMLAPTYNATNRLGGGCYDPQQVGLTRLGEQVVAECNRVGIVLDGSHGGRRATLEMIDRSSQPVIFSHSSADALAPHPRNITDEQIRACAARGGVIGVTSWAPLVLKADQTERPTVDDFVDQIDYVAQLTGSIDAVGIGTDMSLGTYVLVSGDPWTAGSYRVHDEIVFGRYKHITADSRSNKLGPIGFSTFPEITNVIERLEQRGYSGVDIGKVLGENWLRIFEQVWPRSVVVSETATSGTRDPGIQNDLD